MAERLKSSEADFTTLGRNEAVELILGKGKHK